MATALQQPNLDQGTLYSTDDIPLKVSTDETKRPSRQLWWGVAFLLVVAAIELVVAGKYRLVDFSDKTSTKNKKPPPPTTPRFLVIGDWGRDGDYNQAAVADAMARLADNRPQDFIISTGDNFYESGMTSVQDAIFDTSFTQIYNHTSLQVPWKVVLGNHDHGEVDDPDIPPKNCPKSSTRNDDDDNNNEECFWSPLHQLDPRLIERDWRWHCERSFVYSVNDDLDIFFIDTTPIVDDYLKYKWAENKGGIISQSWQDQLAELGTRLARSSAGWKLVVGHHPIRSNHRPDLEYPDLVERLEPLLVTFNVQAYFAGHDHNLQYRVAGGLVPYAQITSGAGSRLGSGFYGDEDAPFQLQENGFVAVEVGSERMKVEYYGLGGDESLFTAEIEKRLI